VPAQGKNRITAMVKDRPDWVLSRQRAWGVPITLFVKKGTSEYLKDADVNARIIAAVNKGGADVWYATDPQVFLGATYKAQDYERVNDILDVWFDSGCTHAFVLEGNTWPELSSPADLYLEGSDQHRGWFQSSLLESCGTRGRAPYKAVLTHGMTLDQNGKKMSKSDGNTIAPQTLIKDYGADILRLWAIAADHLEDHRIGKEIMGGAADAYRKLRNTLRYLLGALHGFSDAEILSPADMPELEQYMLHKVAELDGQLKQHVNDFELTAYYVKLFQFCTTDLSAFYFDIRKDSLYCDGVTNPQRRAARTVMDIIFKALVKWLAPILVFTAEEVWQSRYGAVPSVHLGTYEDIDPQWINEALATKWTRLKEIRSVVTGALEIDRREKRIGASLESAPLLWLASADDQALVQSVHFADICITSDLTVTQEDLGPSAFALADVIGVAVQTQKSAGTKCARCWQVLNEVGSKPDHPELCLRCYEVVA
jgi:isoleucyl-tRNA synthetase